jgi:hypothetical protein
LLAAGACSTLYPVQIETLGAGPASPRKPQFVEIFEGKPDRNYVEVARLTTESMNYDSPGHAVDRLRTVAAEYGADAIIVTARGTRSGTPRYPGPSTDADFGFAHAVQGNPYETGYSSACYARAVAIRWTEPDPIAPQSQPSAERNK